MRLVVVPMTLREANDFVASFHRHNGRTARNGASGFAITLCDGTERAKLRDVERLIRRTLPVSGEIRQPELTPPAERKPHRGQGPRPAGRDTAGRPGEAKPQRNAGRHFSGAKKAAIADARGGKPRPQGRRQAAR